MDDRDPVAVIVMARALCVARGRNPDALHQNYFDTEPVDGTLANGKTAHFGWRHYVDPVRAQIAALEAAGYCIEQGWQPYSKAPESVRDVVPTAPRLGQHRYNTATTGDGCLVVYVWANGATSPVAYRVLDRAPTYGSGEGS